jgi:gluconokinase
MKFPRSGYDQVGGLYYFARMLDKIRLHAKGELPSDYHANLGKGMDGRCTRYLHVDHGRLSECVKAGASDAEAFAWCETNGRKLSEDETLAWNAFVSKRGWKDEASQALQEAKERNGLGERKDLETFFEYFEVDEKRKP